MPIQGSFPGALFMYYHMVLLDMTKVWVSLALLAGRFGGSVNSVSCCDAKYHHSGATTNSGCISMLLKCNPVPGKFNVVVLRVGYVFDP